MAVSPAELARTLTRRHADEHARAALRADELRRAVEREVTAAAASGLVRRAWLIGSLAAGTYGAGSDVDLVVEGLVENRAAALWDRLTASLGARVDLLRLEALPEPFQRRVLAEGVALRVA